MSWFNAPVSTCGLLLSAGLSSAAAAPHRPVFTWQMRGDANYRQGIYDGDEPIALLDLSTMDEPMQALMMFGKVPRPILLRHLKLTPGGRPLVEAVQLYWKSGEVITDQLDGLTVAGAGTDRLTVTFTVKDARNTLTVTRVLTGTYDDALASYVYDFRDQALVHAPERLAGSGAARFEYCDPWLTACPAPSQAFPGAWRGRYRQYVYEAAGGAVVAIPHHHYANSQKGGIALKRDGLFAAVYEPDGNPAIQLLDETAARTAIGICPWGYDIHMNTHFRLFRCPDDQARRLNAAAVAPPPTPADEAGLAEIPMYERVSSFEKGIAVGKPRAGDLDPWGWVPQGEPGPVWDRQSGRTGAHSLKIAKATPGLSSWHAMAEGQGYFTEPWTPCKGYEISVWAKTENVTGPGASIGACYHVPNVPPAWPIACSARLAGSQGWTRLTLRVGPPPKDTSIMSLHLQQDGAGTTWFDDLDVRMLK